MKVEQISSSCIKLSDDYFSILLDCNCTRSDVSKLDLSKIDIVLVSNQHACSALIDILESQHFRGVVLATEPVLRLFSLVNADLPGVAPQANVHLSKVQHLAYHENFTHPSLGLSITPIRYLIIFVVFEFIAVPVILWGRVIGLLKL